MPKGYKHLTREQRNHIQKYQHQWSQKLIAESLEVSQSTVSRGIARSNNPTSPNPPNGWRSVAVSWRPNYHANCRLISWMKSSTIAPGRLRSEGHRRYPTAYAQHAERFRYLALRVD